MYKQFFKRIFDFVVALVILLVLSPLLFLSSLLILVTSKGPLFYFQNRIGLEGREFKIYKFRTMTDKIRTSHQEVLKGNTEVTWIGDYLRRFKIDELPQLLNVLFGDMSLVGPRPCLPEQLESFNEDAFYRLKVRPGMTGLAQINGNIHLSWEERWKYDRKYVEDLGLVLDFKVLFKTCLIVVRGEDKFINKLDA